MSSDRLLPGWRSAASDSSAMLTMVRSMRFRVSFVLGRQVFMPYRVLWVTISHCGRGSGWLGVGVYRRSVSLGSGAASTSSGPADPSAARGSVRGALVRCGVGGGAIRPKLCSCMVRIAISPFSARPTPDTKAQNSSVSSSAATVDRVSIPTSTQTAYR